VLLALVMDGVTGSSAPAAGAVGSYYASAAAWAWNATWLFGIGKLGLSVTVALVSGGITALIVRRFKGNWLLSLIGGVGGTVGGAALVLLGVFVLNLVQYPVIHEAAVQSQSRPHALGTDATFVIVNALRAANLRVPGGWNIIYTRPSEQSALIQSNLTTILREALGEVHFLDMPEYSINADAPRLPEPAGSGITIHGNNALVYALRVLAGCFSIKITQKTVDGLEQFYGVQNLVWIEMGKGSPWHTDLACSG
jgi:hypothetical protein